MRGNESGVGRTMRTLATLVLGLWLDAEEREEVLEDLGSLAAAVETRRGRVAAAAWFTWELLKYPFYLLGTTRASRPLPTPLRAHRGRRAEAWIRELRFASRRVLRRPGASLVVIGTLALGVGSGTAVFAVLDTLVLRPLPFHEAHRLVRIRDLLDVGSGPPRESTMAPARFEAVRDRAASFEDVGAARYRTFTLGGEGEPERVIGLTATWNHFTVLGVTAALGRTFTPEEDAPAAPAQVVVISESLWTRRFARSPDAVGAELVIDGRPHTVIGVMPPGFRYPYAGEAWIPMGIDPAAEDYATNTGLNVTGRLADGVDPAAARAELESLAALLALDGSDGNRLRGYTFKSISEEVLEGMPRRVAALLGAAVFILLIGATNVASTVLARLHLEERELNVQVALGAGRSDLARRFLAEGLVLMTWGLAAGLALSAAAVGPLTRLSPIDDLGPYFQDFGIDLRVSLFGAALALGAMAIAWAPTLLKLRRGQFADTLRTRSAKAGRGLFGLGFLDLLVAAEQALAVLLLTGAGLTVQSVWNEWSESPGIRTEALYTASVAPTPGGYRDAASRTAYLDDVAARVGALPGVSVVGYTNLNPLRSQGWGAAVFADGTDPEAPGSLRRINHRGVSAGYFDAAGTRILRGRGFRPSDGPGSPPVAVISERLADALWPGQDAVGQRLRLASSTADPITVVGVAENVKEFDFLTETWYRPYAQMPADYNTLVVELFVRTARDDGAGGAVSAQVLEAVRAAIRQVDPNVAVFRIQAMTDVLKEERRVESFATLLLGLFAAIGLVLAAGGTYGVLSYVTGRRTREIGLRVALGADRGDIILDVVGRTLKTSLVGLGVGMTAATVLTPLAASLLVEVPSFSPLVYATSCVVALAVVVVAALGPTLRALMIQPRAALADE